MKNQERIRKIKKTALAFALMLAFAGAFLLTGAQTTQAATSYTSGSFVGKKKIFTYNHFSESDSKTKTIKVDVTGDNKKDKVEITAVKVDAYESTKLTIKVNGEKVLSKTLSQEVSVYFLRQSKNREFLFIESRNFNAYCEYAAIFKYNKSTGKLKSVLSMNSYAVGNVGMNLKVTENRLVVSNTYRTYDSYGEATDKYTYKFKNGKFRLLKKSS